MRAAPLAVLIALALASSTPAVQAQTGTPQLGSPGAADAMVADSGSGATPAVVQPVSLPWVVGRVTSDSLARGPRLPDVVHPVTPRLADEAAVAAAAPKNIVIPVTTVVIVLAVVVVVLLID